MYRQDAMNIAHPANNKLNKLTENAEILSPA